MHGGHELHAARLEADGAADVRPDGLHAVLPAAPIGQLERGDDGRAAEAGQRDRVAQMVRVAVRHEDCSRSQRARLLDDTGVFTQERVNDDQRALAFEREAGVAVVVEHGWHGDGSLVIGPWSFVLGPWPASRWSLVPGPWWL